MKPRVYVETTIPSYLTAGPTRDLIRAARQQLTREWWDRRDVFDLFISRVVLEECEAGDPAAAAGRLSVLADATVVELTEDVIALADVLVERLALPPRVAADAAHIAAAAAHRMKYLVTWNCSHIANVALRPRIEAVCRAAGYEPPLICTPEELQPEDEP